MRFSGEGRQLRSPGSQSNARGVGGAESEGEQGGDRTEREMGELDHAGRGGPRRSRQLLLRVRQEPRERPRRGGLASELAFGRMVLAAALRPD